MIGAVPATWTCGPTRTALEYPTVATNGESAGTIRLSMALVSPAVEALRQVEGWPAATVAVAALRGGRGNRLSRPAGARLPVGLRDQAGDRAGDARRRRGGHPRPRRSRRARGLDHPAPARARLGPAVRGREADRTARPAADLLEHGLRGARRDGGRCRRDAVREVPRRGGAAPAGDQRGASRLAGRRALRNARRPPASLAAELQRPKLVAPETLAEATSVQFPGLVGVLPDIGRMEPNDWGLGVELRDAKVPHWTGTSQLAAHVRPFRREWDFPLGRSRRRSRARMSDRPRVRPWALEAWPRLSDDVFMFL